MRPLAMRSVDGDPGRTLTAVNGPDAGLICQRQRHVVDIHMGHGCQTKPIDCQTEMAENLKMMLCSRCRYQKIPIMMCVVVTVYQTGVAGTITKHQAQVAHN